MRAQWTMGPDGRAGAAPGGSPGGGGCPAEGAGHLHHDRVRRDGTGLLPSLPDQAAHSRHTSLPPRSSASWLRWCTRKQREQVNSSAWRGITRNDSSSLDRSAPGSSSDSATSSGSTSIVLEDLSIRLACSSCRLSSVISSSVLRRLSYSVAIWVLHPLHVHAPPCNAQGPQVVPESGGEFCHVRPPGTRKAEEPCRRRTPRRSPARNARESPVHEVPPIDAVNQQRVRMVTNGISCQPRASRPTAPGKTPACPTSCRCRPTILGVWAT